MSQPQFIGPSFEDLRRIARKNQQRHALSKGTRVRQGRSHVIAAVRAHEQSLEGALADERARGLTVYEILLAQHGWGRERVLLALKRTAWRLWGEQALAMAETRRVGDLTPREREALIAAAGDRRTAA